MHKFLIFLVLALMVSSPLSLAKDKSIASEYPVILIINKSGEVVEVITEDAMPEQIKKKAVNAFIGKNIGVKYRFGRAVSYKQKLIISTKHLIDNSKISRL